MTYGFMTILKQMTAATMATVENNSIAGAQMAHQCCHRHVTSPQQQMEVVWNEGQIIQIVRMSTSNPSS
jgi:hypothetical protein